MTSGKIRRIVRGRGFGFIANRGGKDIFFHQNQLLDVDFSSLREGQSVKYRVGLGIKGLEAVDIKLAGKPLHVLTG